VKDVMLSDEKLMRHLVRGNQSALESLYDRHSKTLYSVALRITRDAGTAEELLQDIFFQLWQRASQFDRARGSLIGWLITITRNRAISCIRYKRDQFREPFYENAAASLQSRGPTVLQLEIARELVSTAMAVLTQVQSEAITLAYFEGFTCEEIAVRTKTPLGTIKRRLRCAVEAMNRTLSNPNSATLAGGQSFRISLRRGAARCTRLQPSRDVRNASDELSSSSSNRRVANPSTSH
jgi:RNA polymerase sigma-70 factor (ECF subfamily)